MVTNLFSLFADPEKAGQVQKRLKITTTPDGKGFFFNLQVMSKLEEIQSSTLTLPVSYSDFYVMKTLIEFSLPRMLGFDQHSPNNMMMASSNVGNKWEAAPPTPPPPAYRVIE